jgi:hypothetical protein
MRPNTKKMEDPWREWWKLRGGLVQDAHVQLPVILVKIPTRHNPRLHRAKISGGILGDAMSV